MDWLQKKKNHKSVQISANFTGASQIKIFGRLHTGIMHLLSNEKDIKNFDHT